MDNENPKDIYMSYRINAHKQNQDITTKSLLSNMWAAVL